MPYLSGDAKVLMFVTLSPAVACFQQTLCTLRFAEKVKSCSFGKIEKHVSKIATPMK